MTQRNPAPVLDGFTFVDWLGGGGFADVFRYRQEGLNREVAVKVLHRGVNSKTLAAFNSEASLMAKLSNHPNIVSIYQAGVADDGRPFLVMEMCSAPHLGQRVSRRLYGPAKAMEVGVQIAGAVETAHRLGILHRDIKPANILFTEFGRPALTDFGISVSAENESIASAAMSPQWAPPEQFGDSAVGIGPWSDVYSLAATLWATLVGHSPMYVAGQPHDMLTLRARARTMVAPRTGRADVPEQLERVLAVAMTKNPQERFQSVLEFARALQGVQASINQSVTPIDVLSDQPEFGITTGKDQDEKTRISGFVLIDPEVTENTSQITGPSGGLTTPTDQSQWSESAASSASASLTVIRTDPVLKYGRGVADPGLRDFTENPVPSLPAEPSQEIAVEIDPVPDQNETARPRRIWWPATAVISVTAVGALVFSALKAGVNATTANTPAQPSTSVVAADPLLDKVPKVEDLQASVQGYEVKFSWRNPDPRPGDTYTYQVITLAGNDVKDFTAQTHAVVPAVASGQTCLEVSLVRSNGRSSEPVRQCTA